MLLRKIPKLKPVWVLFKAGIGVSGHLIERIIIVTIADVFEEILLICYY